MSGCLPIPAAAEPIVQALRREKVFTQPTLKRFLVLMSGLIVTMGRRTVSRTLKAMQPRLKGHWSNYHRIYSSARYSSWKLAAVLVRLVIALLPCSVTITLLADETVDGKEGPKVWAMSGHRDPVRSTRSKTTIKFGHKWLVMCVLVQLPGIDRPWALPVLCGLCLSAKEAKKLKRRPKTPSQLARQLLMQLMRWLPQRRFILIGDFQVVTHQTVRFAQRHADRVTVVGRLRGDANFYAAPTHPRRVRGGVQAAKGLKLPGPAQRAAQLTACSKEIQWYGSSRRTIRYAGETALWHDKHGRGVTPIRWVCVYGDPSAGLDNAYFYSSDLQMSASRIVELYASRWNIEVTFEESRALLGLETTRHWCRQSVLRVTPMLLGLFTAVALMWSNLPAATRRCRSSTPCYRKQTLTFADALFAVRRELWLGSLLLRHRGKQRCLNCLPRRLRNTILWHLAAAA